MSTIARRLHDLNIELPRAAAPAANYVPYVLSGPTLFIAGQIPFLNGQEMHKGRLGENLGIEDGMAAARACGLNILSQLHAATNGDWTRVKRCVKLGGFVNCTPDFTAQPQVINGASDLMVDVLGEEIGRHARFAVGEPSLPLGVAVEIDAIFELESL